MSHASLHGLVAGFSVGLALFCCLFAGNVQASGSRLLGAGGITNVSGSAGGGITTWAVLNGYASDTETSINASAAHVGVDDFGLDTLAVGYDWADRVAVTVAANRLHVDALDTDIHRQVAALKLRLYGDALYDRFGQFSAGLEYGHNSDMAIPRLLGSTDADGVDVYLAASKVFLGALFGRNVILNATARASRANQLGLLGYGRDNDSDFDNYALLGEAAGGVFLTPNLLLGGEYRQKPDHLQSTPENDWYDVFAVYAPNKYLAISAAWVNLGDIAGFRNQRGYFISLQTGFGS